MKTLEATRARGRVALGLQQPSPKAPSQESAAYDAIAHKDEATVAWIIKQDVSPGNDLFSVSPTPYCTATTMLRQTRALGNLSSQRYAAKFLQYWRERGSPFQNETR